MRFIVLGVLWSAVFLAAICITESTKGAVNPPTIEDCRSDMECDIAAKILCDDGHIEWCIKEA